MINNLDIFLAEHYKNKKIIFLDFEFCESENKHPTLVCASLHNWSSGKSKCFWLSEDPAKQQELASTLRAFQFNGFHFCSYNVVAEARCFLALGLDPVHYPWIDLMLEHRQLTNHHTKIAYGPQLIKGKVVHTVNETKWGKSKEQLDAMNRAKPVCSLASACFKFLGKLIDTEHKSQTIDLILRVKRGFNAQQRARISKYCSEDVVYLPSLLTAMVDEYSDWWARIPRIKKKSETLEIAEPMRLRGEFAALESHQVSIGYPVKRDWFENFLYNAPEVIKATQQDIASQFEEYPIFVRKYKKKNDDLRMSTKNVKAWIKERSGFYTQWPKTDTGSVSLDAAAWKKFFDFKHDYPRGNYAAQFIRWKALQTSMSGFKPRIKPGANHITDNYSKIDGRIRPYLNCYAAGTSRSQPRSTFFLPLKSAFVRSMIYEESEDKFMVGCDYGSQEVLVQACLSGDRNLYESYISGDVYLDFAKKAKAIPLDGTKTTHGQLRDDYKTAFLAISYGVGYRTLSNQLSSKSGLAPDEDRAKELIEQYYEVYHVYKEWIDSVKRFYGFEFENGWPQGSPSGLGYLKLSSGWIQFGNNLSHKSVQNFLIQGTAADCMRRACKIAHDIKLPILYTLHDALYAECRNLEDVNKLRHCMRQGFIEVMQESSTIAHTLDWSKSIRLDANAWGEYFKNNSLDDDTVQQDVIYVDKRGEKSFNFFKQYFEAKHERNQDGKSKGNGAINT